ncbi:MAG: hypothetical protein GC154_01950 [bacterium]|nr:hypothetical protein [bacterium]
MRWSLFRMITLIIVLAGCVLCAGAEEIQCKAYELALKDSPIADYQIRLLDAAIGAATVIPATPHIKDRSRAQEAVVEACLELGQPLRAYQYLEKIDNWRKGSCYADLAYYCASHGAIAEASVSIDRAEAISETTDDWRRDTIRVKIARTHFLLGQIEEAKQFASGVVDSETGKLETTEAASLDEESFDEQVKKLDALIEPGQFDVLKNALDAYAQLFDRFYEDEAKRALTEEKIKSSWKTLPIFLRIELLNRLAESALSRSDDQNALRLIDESLQYLDDYSWKPEDYIPQISALLILRYRAGGVETAREQAGAALALFNDNREKIVNIWRAGALRPLAEAYQAIGDHRMALSVYRQALDEGVENPNSRPRAEDLSATCVSMALHSVEPDEATWNRIDEIREGLGQPW